jgi:Cdc6-like AAA superfamily ATPase
MAEKRLNKVITLIGTRGTGKTTKIKKVIEAYLKANPTGKILVVDTLDHPSYRDIKPITIEQLQRWLPTKGGYFRLYGSNTTEIMEYISKFFFNGLLIFEDASKYIGSRLDDNVKAFILDSKQKNLDIVFMFHSWGFVPNDLFRLTDAITIFKTQDTPFQKKNFLPFELIEKPYKEIKDSQDRFINKTVELL